ncbi:TPA: hypothetical protein VGS73_003456 [Vibrio cholerae]|uniref:O-antigen ligase family protein n=1 Tax=Vibrio cholerae TaxID=666 RepID=UPI001F3B40B5|nr:O-antigen ligase family protein [Vibrio cholerae]UIP03941.1 hypothetical protein LY388_18640 [Vibrio cholerae]HEQ3434730.1 hypothetical protein [Vibrio cholerae]HEQ3495609.1 hypothetical protein [Vibrio cholerae]HEQ3507364.1 hypothetical protein [Vibrio cholerae]HEQ3571201.1 hypothetical protein [Vibrio cholerae]
MDRNIEKHASLGFKPLVLSLSFAYVLFSYILDSFISDNLYKYFGNTGAMFYIKLSALAISVSIYCLYRFKFYKVELCFLVFYVVYISTSFVGTDSTSEAFYFWSNIIGYLGVYIVTRALINHVGYDNFVFIMIFSALAVVLLSLYVDFSNYERASFRDDNQSTYVCSNISIRKCGVSNNPNTLAILLMPFFLEILYAMYKGVINKILTPSLLIVFFMIFISGSKTIIAMSLLSMMLYGLTMGLFKVFRYFMYILIVIMIGLNIDLIQVVFNERFVSKSILDSSGRYEIYLGVLSKLSDNIFYGVGLNLHEDYSNFFPGWLRLADSAYANILVSTGIVGIIIFIVLLSWQLYFIYKFDVFRLCLFGLLLFGFFFEDILIRSYSFLFFLAVTFSMVRLSREEKAL